MLRVYTYQNCDTCRRAVKFLQSHGCRHEVVPIRETPPQEQELRTMLAAYGGELRRLCNTSGGDYKALQLKDRLPRMTPTEAIQLLAQNGNLVKRPFLIGPGVALVGFDAGAWSKALKF